MIDQVLKIQSIYEKVSSIKENYDKKFDGLVSKFSEIEEQFTNEYFEDKILGELKNSQEMQTVIVDNIKTHITKISKLQGDVQILRANSQDFFLFEGTRNKLETVQKQVAGEERELKKLSCKIADYHEIDIQKKFSELLKNTFILKKSYSSSKFVHYFEWGSKCIHFYDVQKFT